MTGGEVSWQKVRTENALLILMKVPNNQLRIEDRLATKYGDISITRLLRREELANYHGRDYTACEVYVR